MPHPFCQLFLILSLFSLADTDSRTCIRPTPCPHPFHPLVLVPPTNISNKTHAPQHNCSLITSPSQTVGSTLCQPAHSKLHGLNHQNFDFHSLLLQRCVLLSLLLLHTSPLHAPALLRLLPSDRTPTTVMLRCASGLLKLDSTTAITLCFGEPLTPKLQEWRSRRGQAGDGRERKRRDEEHSNKRGRSSKENTGLGSFLSAPEVCSSALERKGPSHTHLLRPVAGVCPCTAEEGQPGLCSWDWWCWWWFFSAPWVMTMLSSSPSQGGCDGVSSSVRCCRSDLFSFSLICSIYLSAPLALVSAAWLTAVGCLVNI